jgi:hypothetical protein
MIFAFLIRPNHSSFVGQLPPSPWFNEHVTLRPFELPSGVSISLAKNEYSKVPLEYLVIENDSSTVLYIVEKPFTAIEFDELSAGLPDGTGLLHKIVNGKAYQWDSEWDESSSSYYYAWFPVKFGRENSLWVYVYGNQIESRDGLIAKLEPRNQFDGDRPENVEIPQPQDAILPILYGDEEIKIPITVSYSLNPDYGSFDPNVGSDDFGDEIIEAYLGYSICGLFLAILLFIAWKGKKPTRDRYARK